MLDLVRYTNSNATLWNEIVAKSRNGTFLFNRGYMDYHSDRFDDLSYLIYKKGKPEGIIPGNHDCESFFSHAGLTYGGVITTVNINTVDMMNIFELLISDLKSQNISRIVYKPIPQIYHQIPAQEDIYSLFRLNAKKIGCNISTAIYQMNKPKFAESRKSGLRKAVKNNVKINQTDNIESFWELLTANLSNKYSTLPVHNLTEIKYLHYMFPNNIKLYVACSEKQILAGCVVFETNNVIHTQYISASEYGKSLGALDLLFDYLINEKYTSIPIFDFGQSTEQMGIFLNENLIFQKEGFGGRGVVYETYEISL